MREQSDEPASAKADDDMAQTASAAVAKSFTLMMLLPLDSVSVFK
jgi:hypothetical protein